MAANALQPPMPARSGDTREGLGRSSATRPSGGGLALGEATKAPVTRDQFPLTGALDAVPELPPANPYADPVCAMLSGASSTFVVSVGPDARVGRDPRICALVLDDVRVSQVHGALRWENRQLWVRDENSQNGTFIDDSRVPPAVWMPVRSGATVRFGGTEFNVRYE